jgi:hypothetical protein
LPGRAEQTRELSPTAALAGLPVADLDLTLELRAVARRRPRPTATARALWRWLDEPARAGD